MAFPDAWAMTQEQLDWDQKTGWRMAQTWRGPSGAGKVTRAAWLEEWKAVYGQPISLSFRDFMPLEDGWAVCEASIAYAATEDGDPIEPGAEDYGLIERTWTLSGVDQQLSIRENPRVELLAQFWRPWPSFIRDWVYVYTQAQAGALKTWNDAGQTADVITPVWQIPIPPASVGSPGPVLLQHATILADRILTDPQATWAKSGYQLKKTERVTSWSTLVVSHLYVDRLLTWGSLVVQEPTLEATGLIQTGGLEPLLWLKAAPEVSATSGGNYELSQTYTSFERPDAGTKREDDLLFDYGEIV